MSFIDLLTAFSIIFGGWTYYFDSTLKDKASTVSLIDTLAKHNYFEFYRLRLKSSLDSLDNYIGKPSWSWSAIGKNLSLHYLLAIGYVFLVFFLIWFLGGENSIGAIEILPKKESYLERFTVLVAIAFIGVLFYFLTSKEFEKIDEKFQKKFQALLPENIQKHSTLIQKGIISLIAFLTFYQFNSFATSLFISIIFGLTIDSLLYAIVGGVVVGGGVVVVVGGVGVGVGVVVGGGGGVVVGVVVGVGGVGVVVGVVVGGVVVGVVGGVVGVVVLVLLGIESLIETGVFFNAQNISLLIFFLLIPFLNGILDFISLSLSRYFSRKILNENLFLIVIHLILDFIFALLFLVALVFLLKYSIGLFNSLVDTKLQIPLATMIDNAINNPWSIENAWVSFMLLSTLVPTLLHILLALVSILLYVTRTSYWFIHHVEESQTAENKRIKTSALLAFPLTILSAVLFYLLIYMPFIAFLPKVA